MNFTDIKEERYGDEIILSLTINDLAQLDRTVIGMMSNNQIKGLVPFTYSQIDERIILKYSVSGKICAKDFYSNIMSRNKIVNSFFSIIDTFIAIEDYMIDENKLLLNIDYMFVDQNTYEVSMMCIPLKDKIKNDILTFIKNIIFSSNYSQNESNDYVVKIMNYINSTNIFSVKEFKNVLSAIEKDIFTNITNNIPTFPTVKNVDSNVSMASNKQYNGILPNKVAYSVSSAASENVEDNEEQISWLYLMQHYNKENAAKYKAQKAKRKNKKNKSEEKVNVDFRVPGVNNKEDNNIIYPQNSSIKESNHSTEQKGVLPAFTPRPVAQSTGDFGDTTVLMSNVGNETTVLISNNILQQQQSAYMIRKKNNEKIPINKPRFRIGKEKGYVDYFIGDNTAISRSHADIVTNENGYIIIDMNSTNHTFINDSMIQSGSEVQINHGDRIRLANEEFEFRIY